MLHELDASEIGFLVTHVDVRVQGADAAASVAAAVRTLGRRGVDVIVVVRGGGSRTDLATFDHERVALAIARAPVPVLTGLGHEIDRSVADEVAHRAFKTPTACAAALVERVRLFSAAVSSVGHRIAARTTLALRLADQQVGHAGVRLRREAGNALVGTERHLAVVADRLARRPVTVLRDAERGLDGLEARVRSLDPALVLARGWSITRRTDGTLVRSVDAVTPGDELVTTLADGSVRSRVDGSPP